MKTIIKIKNPGLAYQASLFYLVTKELKTIYHCRLVGLVDDEWVDIHQGKDYKVSKRVMTVV